MTTSVLSGLFVKIVVMIGLGFVLKKTGFISDVVQQALSRLLVTAILPFSMLASANTSFSGELASRLWQCALICTGYYAVSLAVCFGLSRLPLSGSTRSHSFVLMAVFATIGFIGLPLVRELCGNEGFLYGIVYNLVFQLFMFTLGILLLDSGRRFSWRTLLTNPSALASVAAILIYLSPFRFPSSVAAAFSSIGDMCVPLSMIIIGCLLTEMRPRELWSNPSSFLVSLLRLLVFPLALFFLLRPLGLDSTLLLSCVALTAVPPGTLNAVLGEQYHCDMRYITCTLAQSTLLFFVLFPVVVGAVQALTA